MSNKQSIIVALIIFLVSSCMEPRNRRDAYRDWGPSSQDTSGNGQSTTTPDSDESSNPVVTPSPPVTNFPTDIDSGCRFSADGVSGYGFRSPNFLGDYSLCRSTENTSKIHVQVKRRLSSNQLLCFIPSNHENQSGIVPVGNPFCTTANNSRLIKALVLQTLSSYGPTSINGVMIIIDDSYTPGTRSMLDVYLECMRGNIYLCEQFDRSGQYIYHNFTPYNPPPTYQ
ncbi:MAG: hypothetical protein ISR65_10020 [Bacteriovoracaceae bacterium]|nr:hypothetical protein [Bacteriovoracaceae bacterium]